MLLLGVEVRGGTFVDRETESLELAVNHLVFAAILAITIVGLPFARQHIKLIPLSLLPFGRDLR